MTPATALPRLLLGLVIAGTAIWLALDRERPDTTLIESAVRDLGLLAPLAHLLLFAVATILFVPGLIFGLAGGALFGPLLGTIFNLAGATLGATAAFLIARYVAGDWARSKAGTRLDRLVSGVEAEGWRFVASRSLPISRKKPAKCAIVLDGRRRPTTRLECAVMLTLLQASGRVITRDEMLAEIWNTPFAGSNKVDAVVGSLRKRLAAFAPSIETVTGHGYRFRVEEGDRRRAMIQPLGSAESGVG